MIILFLIVILGFVLLIYGADLLVKGASNIAHKLHISEIVVGLTIVALGTSLPELIITLVSSSKESHDLIIGNVIGSNICNLLLILGILSVIKPIKFEKSIVKKSLPILTFINILVLAFCFIPLGHNFLEINYIEGTILLLIALIYFTTPIVKHFKSSTSKKQIVEASNATKSSIIKDIIFIILGGFALKYGGDFVVNSSIEIANFLNITQNIIGLTIIAFGTSLPELITSIVAVVKGNDNIAEGNIIGSCMLNFCFILGLGAVISTIILDSKYIENLILLIASTILIWLYGISNKDYSLKRVNGIILLLIFNVYIIRLLTV